MGIDSKKLDPLTCSGWTLRRLFDDPEWDCSCGMVRGGYALYGAQHREWCNITPIYGEMVREAVAPPREQLDWIIASTSSIKSTIIKCAHCGKEGLARNMEVVYRTRPGQRDAFSAANIHRAVCPEHNRQGMTR